MRRTPAEDYLTLAAERGMTLTGVVPPNAATKTSWKCNNCGRIYQRSLTQMRQIPHCRCRGKKLISRELYIELGNLLGIRLLADTLPLRTSEITIWMGHDGRVFEASYHQLSRPHIPLRFREHLTPDYEAPPSNYVEVPHSLELKRLKRVSQSS